MNQRVGLITIGQSPRPDIVGEIKKAMGGKQEIIEAGALDGLSRNEILSLSSSPEDYRVITALNDGPIVVAKKHILARMETVFRKFEGQSVRLAAILCTEEFPEYSFKGVLLKPGKLLLHFISSFHQKGKGVVVIPLEEQKKSAAKKWNLSDVEIRVKVLAPGSNLEEIQKLSKEIESENPGFVVLECFGYDENLKRVIQERLSCPVILPRTLLGYALKEITGA